MRIQKQYHELSKLNEKFHKESVDAELCYSHFQTQNTQEHISFILNILFIENYKHVCKSYAVFKQDNY